jgi:hypothetical protein
MVNKQPNINIHITTDIQVGTIVLTFYLLHRVGSNPIKNFFFF